MPRGDNPGIAHIHRHLEKFLPSSLIEIIELTDNPIKGSCKLWEVSLYALRKCLRRYGHTPTSYRQLAHEKMGIGTKMRLIPKPQRKIRGRRLGYITELEGKTYTSIKNRRLPGQHTG